MISKRIFYSITILILVVLFMFQILGVLKEKYNVYHINPYEEETKTLISYKDYYVPVKDDVGQTRRDYIIYVGEIREDSLLSMVEQWCMYTKRGLFVYERAEEIEAEKIREAEAILVDTRQMDFARSIPVLDDLVEREKNIVFLNLPAPRVIEEYRELRNILGIQSVFTREITLSGIRLYQGFLLGGEAQYRVKSQEEESYQDMELVLPWYRVSTGTKTYMTGMLEEDSGVRNENLPAIIWRNSIGASRIFAVNGNYIEGNTGLGILSAMMAESKEYDIYPVVNAQVFAAVNAPVLTSENSNKIYENYSRSSIGLFKNVIWPGLISQAQKMNDKITFMMNVQFDYSDNNEPEEKELEYYFKLASENKGEISLSASAKSEISLEEKFHRDYNLIKEGFSKYSFLGLYGDDYSREELREQFSSPLLEDVRVILQEYEEKESLLSFEDDMLYLRTTIDGFQYTFSRDLRVKSLQTALGYSIKELNMERVLYPKTKEDGWERLYHNFSKFNSTYWKEHRFFDSLTLSEADKRVREFLAMDYSDSKEGNSITLRIMNFYGEGWFILRIHNQYIDDIHGGDYEQIEQDVYLIRAKEDVVKIELGKEEREIYLP